MHTKNLLNISLLFTLALLLTITFWPADTPTLGTPTTVAPLLDRESVNTITVTRQGYPSIVLHKKEQQWWLQNPPLAAKKPLVTELLALLESDSLIQYPLSEINPQQVGLEKPSLCIEYNRQQACFGDRNPLNQLRYLQFGTHVHMIYDTLSHQLSGASHDYVSPRLLPEGAHITALTLDNLTLQHNQGRWQVTPQPEHYSADQVQQLLDHWQHARALLVAPYQTTDSEASMTVAFENQKSIQFELVSSDPELILARPDLGIQYHLNEGSLAQLTRLPTIKVASE
ncbi:MAG: hypothetical protein L3J62_01045 [Gammaproteobacteria bacterium]|nr:hypothetical protein [Gammaproteobacteria bacterium]MCF6229370.1 hypothetical protein [Gammaproteobacteria bacterium]